MSELTPETYDPNWAATGRTYQSQIHDINEAPSRRAGRQPRRYMRQVGHTLNWAGVIRGEIVEILSPEESAERGWTRTEYYLVRPTKRYCEDMAPHWVRADEIT